MAIVTFETHLGDFERATKEQLLRAAAIIGGMAESHAKELCPVDTGNLRNSITHVTEEEGCTVVIGTNVEYAPYVELGTHHPRRAPKPYLKPSIENYKDEYRAVIKQELGA